MSKVSEKLYKPTEVEAANVDLRAKLAEVEAANVDLRAKLAEVEAANVDLRAKLAEVEAAEPVEPVKFAPNVKRYGASP